MKKKLIGIATLAALMTLSAGITAFAGWETDAEGLTVFRNSKGNIVYAGWVTDPDTGYEYFMDPDGHIMTGTTVDGYWLDDDGIKHEKSDAQIRAEERRAEREAAYNSPGKETSATNDVAQEAKTSGIAVSTTRRNYQAEMYSISNQAFDTVKKGFEAENVKTLKGATSKTNISNKFYYYNRDGIDVLSSDMPKAVDGSEEYYDYALQLHYNRNIVHNNEVPYLDEAYRRMIVGALGEIQGNYVADQIFAIEVGDDSASLSFEGLTDTGNSYRVRYSTNNADVYVTCSEIVTEAEIEAEVEAEGDEATFAGEAEEFAEEYVAEEEGNGVVMTGAAAAQLEEEVADEVAEELAEDAYEDAGQDYSEEAAADEAAADEVAEESAE